MIGRPFVPAMAMTDTYRPGRGVFWHGGDRATRDTTALLHVTMTAKRSTAGVPGGAALVSIVAGVRFQGGVVASERFSFASTVP